MNTNSEITKQKALKKLAKRFDPGHKKQWKRLTFV